MDLSGKGHTKLDRSKQLGVLVDLFKKEKVAENISGREFKGPKVTKNLRNQYDEASYRSWHMKKEIELNKFVDYCKRLNH